MHLLIYIDIALFIFIAFFIGYDLFFTLASFFRRRHRKHRSIRLQKFAVIFAAYKEDQVIQESVERILLQDYPADKYPGDRGIGPYAGGNEPSARQAPDRAPHAGFQA